MDELPVHFAYLITVNTGLVQFYNPPYCLKEEKPVDR